MQLKTRFKDKVGFLTYTLHNEKNYTILVSMPQCILSML